MSPTVPIGATCASFQALGLDNVLGAARTARELGYRSFWTAETVGPEAFSTLAAAGSVAPGIALGTGVLALQLRTLADSTQAGDMGMAAVQSWEVEYDVVGREQI